MDRPIHKLNKNKLVANVILTLIYSHRTRQYLFLFSLKRQKTQLHFVAQTGLIFIVRTTLPDLRAHHLPSLTRLFELAQSQTHDLRANQHQSSLKLDD